MSVPVNHDHMEVSQHVNSAKTLMLKEPLLQEVNCLHLGFPH